MKRIERLQEWLALAVSVSVFLFFAMMLSVPSGYSYGAALLFVASVFFLFKRPHLELSLEDKAWVVLFLLIFLISFFAFLLHENPPKTMDQASRYVLAIPILLLLLKFPPRMPYVWGGLVVGGVLSAGITLWQRHWLGIERATGFVTSAIPYGDISLTIAVLCLAGLFWANTLQRHTKLWRFALLLGAAAGFYSVIASETRGGWLAVPPILILFYAAFARKFSVKKSISIVAVFIVGLGLLIAFAPNVGIKARYSDAVKEVQMYRHQQRDANAVGGRLAAWQTALASIAKKPLLGWSYKDYTYELQRLNQEKAVDKYVAELANTHNQYLEIWLHEGLAGLLALLALYFYAFYSFCRRLIHPNVLVRVLAVSGASVLAAFFMFGMTQVILGRNNGILFFLVTLSVFWTCMRHEEEQDAVLATVAK